MKQIEKDIEYMIQDKNIVNNVSLRAKRDNLMRENRLLRDYIPRNDNKLGISNCGVRNVNKARETMEEGRIKTRLDTGRINCGIRNERKRKDDG